MSRDAKKKSPIDLLVIDDELGFREMLCFDLARRGYRIVVAADGPEGLQKAREQAFDVVVCDLTMPHMDGLEVLRKLKEMDSSIEVILITGYPTIDIQRVCLDRGAFCLIGKPFDLDELCVSIEQAAVKNREHKTALIGE